MFYRLRHGSYTYNSLVDVVGRDPPCRITQSASGAILPGPPTPIPGGDPFKLSCSDYLLLVTSFQPWQYVVETASAVSTLAKATRVTNCNDRNEEVTDMTSIPIDWWSQGPGLRQVSADGKTIAGTYNNGSDGAPTWTWQLTLEPE